MALTLPIMPEHRLLSPAIYLYFYYLLFSILFMLPLFLLAKNSNAVKMWSKKEAVASTTATTAIYK
jgi:hypothetical protein